MGKARFKGIYAKVLLLYKGKRILAYFCRIIYKVKSKMAN